MKLAQLEKYSENNRIEAKRSTGGFPQSIWETYSAFANTLGGVILLGVEEKKDYSLHAVTLPDPEGLVKEFWRLVNDESKVSVNILTRKQVEVKEVDGKKIVVITVPRANRWQKPVYIGSNPFGGSYRRSGEGDYKCTKEEVESMLRDREGTAPDMQTLENTSLSALDEGSVADYLTRVEGGTALPANQFFLKAGGLALGKDRELHPTAAGLLLFGKKEEIKRIFPAFRLEYREKEASVFGENVYEFYRFTAKKLGEGVPEKVKKALLEGLTNSLVNADYFSGGEVLVECKGTEIVFSNSGGFRIDIERAKTGGLADPRNGGLAKLLQLADIGEGAGSGIPHIYAVWRAQGYATPEIIEEFSPPRIRLRLPLQKGPQKAQIDSGVQRELLISYLTEHAVASERELRSLLGDLTAAEALVTEGIAVKKGGKYKLKR